MIYKTQAEHHFIKEYYFPKLQKIHGHLLKRHYLKDLQKRILIKTQFYLDLSHQLKSSGIVTHHTLSPDFSWSPSDISQIKSYHQLEKYIVLFPFCSPHLTSKKWPYYNDLISIINERLENKFKVVIAPGPGEIKDAASINALCVLDNGKALDISQLAALIKDSSFVVANDTGPAHMTAHLGIKRNCFIWISHNSF
jgi:ADP-heptose:LPS heptosyltransferase